MTMITKQEILAEHYSFLGEEEQLRIENVMEEYLNAYKLNFKRVYCVQDDSGDWYVIPYGRCFWLKDDFNLYVSDMNNEPFDYDLFQKFEECFGEYRTGGDLNLISLYANFDNQ